MGALKVGGQSPAGSGDGDQDHCSSSFNHVNVYEKGGSRGMSVGEKSN